jgi:L-ribulose-5-phosphate 3-epimerase UlaE
MAATNKYLAQSNKCPVGGKATKKPMNSAMTLQEAKSIARHLGLTLREVRSGDYRVNLREGNEATAYYTDNLEDAVKTAIEMARKCGQSPC